MKFFVNLLASSCFIILIVGGMLSFTNRQHEFNMAQEQTQRVLGDSLGEMANAMETMALANIELSKVNQQQVKLLEKQHDDYVNISNRTISNLNRIIIFIIVAIVLIGGMLTLAYYQVKKGYF